MATDVLTLPGNHRLPLWGLGLGLLIVMAWNTTLYDENGLVKDARLTGAIESNWETQGASNCTDAHGDYDAFIPGMRGHAACTRGGFVPGTTVYSVTNTNTSGTGSLSWALSQSSPKVILFDVAGHVDFGSVNGPYNCGTQQGCDNTSIVGASAPGQFAITGGGDSSALRLGGSHLTVDHLIVTSHGRDGITSSDSRDAINTGWQQNGKTHKLYLNSAFIWGYDETFQCYDSTSDQQNAVQLWQTIVGLPGLIDTGDVDHRYAQMNHWMCLQSANIRSVYIHNDGRTPFTRGDGLLHANNISFNSGFQNLLSQPCGSNTVTHYRISIINNLTLRGPDTTMATSKSVAELQSATCKTGTVAIYENGNAVQTAVGQAIADCTSYNCITGENSSGNTMVGTADSYATATGFVPETFDASSDGEITAFANNILEHVGPRPADRLSYIQTRVVDQIGAGLAGTGTMGTYVGGNPALRANMETDMSGEGGFAAITDTGSWDASAQCGGIPASPDAIQSSGLTALHEWVITCFYDSVMPAGYREAL